MRGRVVVVVALVAALGLTGTAGASLPTKAQLRLMPLTKASYGRAATALRPYSVRCFGNAEAARADLVHLTPARLAALGRVNGCSAALELDNNKWRLGVLLSAADGATLFRSTKSARRYLALEARNARSASGGKLRTGGPTLTDVSTFAVPGLDGAFGIRAAVPPPQLKGRLTVVQFREGAIVASVGVLRTDERDARAYVRRLAAAADRRIRGVLAGRIHDRR